MGGSPGNRLLYQLKVGSVLQGTEERHFSRPALVWVGYTGGSGIGTLSSLVSLPEQ